jgi:hypothetical protein
VILVVGIVPNEVRTGTRPVGDVNCSNLVVPGTHRYDGAGGDVPARRKKAKKAARPRVPLPRQTGGVHEDKTKRPWRRRKHKKDAEE